MALLVLGVAFGAVYILKPDWIRPLLRGTPLEPPMSITEAYKWRGSDGSWQITDIPPPEGTPYEVIRVRDPSIVPKVVPRERRNQRN